MKRVSIYKQKWHTKKSILFANWMTIYTADDRHITGDNPRLVRHIVKLHNASLK